MYISIYIYIYVSRGGVTIPITTLDYRVSMGHLFLRMTMEKPGPNPPGLLTNPYPSGAQHDPPCPGERREDGRRREEMEDGIPI